MTAYASVETAVAALRQGAYDHIVKPFDPEDLERLISRAAERGRLLAENRLVCRKLDEEASPVGPVGGSRAMVKSREEIESALATSGGDLSRAARILGIDRIELRLKLREHGLDRG